MTTRPTKLDRSKLWQAMQRASGNCITCGQPTEGRARCKTCLEKRAAYNKKYNLRYRSE